MKKKERAMSKDIMNNLDTILKDFVSSFINNESFLSPTEAKIIEAKHHVYELLTKAYEDGVQSGQMGDD